MKIAACYANAIGNFVIFTSVIQALAHHAGEPVDLILDETWTGEGRDAVELIVRSLPTVCIGKIVNYPIEYVDKYDFVYMSTHSIYNTLAEIFMNKDPNALPDWGTEFYHERDFYYLELRKYLGYDGPVFPQLIVPDESIDLSFIPDGMWICVSNGYQRTVSGKWAKKAYGDWDNVIFRLNKMYPETVFILLGGKDDVGWADRLAKRLNNKRVVPLAGKLNILETAAVLNLSELLLSTDTSVAHIADALKTPSVVLYGSSLVSKNGFLEGGDYIPIISPIECAGCQYTSLFVSCDKTSCTKFIDPRYIIAAARKLIKY